MRDMQSDWKRWSVVERVTAVTLVALLVVTASSLLVHTLGA
jgi:hypothetical protein